MSEEDEDLQGCRYGNMGVLIWIATVRLARIEMIFFHFVHSIERSQVGRICERAGGRYILYFATGMHVGRLE